MKPNSLLLALSVLILFTACQADHQTNNSANQEHAQALTPDADRIKTHMSILADDNMEGREAGTPGYDKAAAYVANEFEDLGLSSAGENGTYFQHVPLRSSKRDPKRVGLQANTANGEPLELREAVDYLVAGSLGSSESDVTAEVVFAGFGIVAPELGRDDYAGLDVEGKIVALLSNTPKGIQSEERAFYGSRKSSEASKRGAIGIITLATPVSEKVYPFTRLVNERRMDATRMTWIQADGEAYSRAPKIQVSASFSMQGAEKLFANAPSSWQEIVAAVEAENVAIPTFKLPLTMQIQQASTLAQVESANVLAMLEGSDPILKNEVLVLSAHLDGIGISKTFEKDKINNGALDNAAGIATLLENARMLLAQGRPRRTVVFFANTAEEKGLLGAQYFAKSPTLGEKQIVANINLDMPVLTYDFQDIVVFGGDRSSLRAAIQSAAKEMNIAIGDDPFPEQGIFTRSDHFRFVEEGVPSVMLATGMDNGGEQAWAEHFAKNYHRPSDDMQNNIDFEAAAKFAELNNKVTLQIANGDNKPLWNKDDFFARQFGGETAE